jgi:signal transduction histidine kinase
MSKRILALAVGSEQDVVSARRNARQVAATLGFDAQDQVRIATAVSEIARNAQRHAGGGSIEFMLQGNTAPQMLLVSVSDKGPGIPDLQKVNLPPGTSPNAVSGIVGAQRLMDRCEIRSTSEGTHVLLKKILPARAPLFTAASMDQLAKSIASRAPATPFEEIRQQNRELIQALAELRERQEELTRLNRELEDTNRGVAALYAELDEKAGHLHRANETKSRFLSNVSHEFRTPLNSIRALTGLLAAHTDGALTPEQEKQVGYIRKSAADLTALVDDLLDLAKIEAGKVDVRPVEFSVENLFSTLRGMLRPLLLTDRVNLRFEDPAGVPLLYADEAKVSQILRNFISNALKFTDRGEVRVQAQFDAAAGAVSFTVADTGIGIAAEDQERIFDEFFQVAGPLQVRVKGTGLGLPLCRKLAALLGGAVRLSSEPEVGSIFSVTIPLRSEVTGGDTHAPANPCDRRRSGDSPCDHEAPRQRAILRVRGGGRRRRPARRGKHAPRADRPRSGTAGHDRRARA